MKHSVACSSCRLCAHAVRDEVDGHGKYDSGVFLGGYLIERLKIAQLERRLGLVDDVGSRLERLRRSLLSLRRYHLHAAHVLSVVFV